MAARHSPPGSPPTRTTDLIQEPDHSCVAQLAQRVRGSVADQAPAAWVAARPHALLSAELIADIQVWRAATQIEASDLRPDQPNLATPLRPGNSNLTSGSSPATPLAELHWGSWSLQKPPTPQWTHSCQS